MNLLDLFVKFSIDDQASDKVTTLSNKVGNGLKKAAEIGTKAVSIAAAGVAALTGAAVKNYAAYEQLVGGVETLFKESSKSVIRYAERAYRTAGVSANEYMEAVTSFSASLLQGLGGDTQKAADMADLAITDMSDNANKMGTSMSSIIATYQSLARGNFAMLDNLKLGFGGTKEEMLRLIDTAANLDKSVKRNDTSFSNLVLAIHAVQTEMGITGTTAKEASTTISGSVASMKASWQNLLTGVADDTRDFDRLVDDFIESAVVAGENILPRIKTALNGAARLIKTMLPRIMDEVPSVVAEVAPQLSSAGAQVVISIVTGIAQNGEKIISAIFDVLRAGASALPDAIAKPIQTTLNGAEKLLTGFFRFVTNNGELVIGVITGIGAAFLAWKIAPVISAAVSAITAFIAATEGATIGQAALNAVMNANPVMLVVAAIGLLVGGVTALAIAYADATTSATYLSESTLEMIDSAQQAAESYNNLKRAADEQASAELAHIDYMQTLYGELRTLADENGRVKAGYEARANFILGELNGALGTEYTMNGNIITQYGDMVNSIDAVIEKKRAQILLEAQEESYRQAVENVAEAQMACAAQAVALAEAQTQMEEAQNAVNAAMENGYGVSQSLQNEYAAAYTNLEQQQQKYNDLSTTVEQYHKDMWHYEEASAALLEGNTEKAMENLSTLGRGFTTAADVLGESVEEQKRKLGEQVTYTEINARLMKEAYERGVEGVSEEMVRTAERQAEQAKEEFLKVGGNITVSIGDGAESKRYSLNRDMQRVVDGAIQAANSKGNSSAGGIGSNITSGIARGISSGKSSVLNAAVNAVKSALAAAKRAAGINSPARVWKDEVGVMLARGMGEGFVDQMPEEISKMLEAVDAEEFASQLGDIKPSVSDGFVMQNAMYPAQNTAENQQRPIILQIDGRELARFLAPNMSAQLAFGG